MTEPTYDEREPSHEELADAQEEQKPEEVLHAPGILTGKYKNEFGATITMPLDQLMQKCLQPLFDLINDVVAIMPQSITKMAAAQRGVEFQHWIHVLKAEEKINLERNAFIEAQNAKLAAEQEAKELAEAQANEENAPPILSVVPNVQENVPVE